MCKIRRGWLPVRKIIIRTIMILCSQWDNFWTIVHCTVSPHSSSSSLQQALDPPKQSVVREHGILLGIRQEGQQFLLWFRVCKSGLVLVQTMVGYCGILQRWLINLPPLKEDSEGVSNTPHIFQTSTHAAGGCSKAEALLLPVLCARAIHSPALSCFPSEFKQN